MTLTILTFRQRMTFHSIKQILHEIKHGVRYLFQTRNTYSLGLAGTGSVGMETALDNIIEPGDRVLVPIYGMWSERVANITWRLGATPITYMIKPYGYTFTLEEIEQGIKEYKPNIVYLVNGETSTGTGYLMPRPRRSYLNI